MTEVKSVEEEIIEYLKVLDDREKQAVLGVVETFATNHVPDRWNDPEFVAEIKRRSYELKNGLVTGLSWEDIKTNARKAVGK